MTTRNRCALATDDLFPRPLLAMLAAERVQGVEIQRWQEALGEVMVEELPPMGPEPFDPWAWPQLSVDEVVPEPVRRAWSRPFQPASQVELATGPRKEFRQTQHHPVGQDAVNSRWWTKPVHQVPAAAAGEAPPYRMCLRTTSGPWCGAPAVEFWGAEDAFFDPWHLLDQEVPWRPVRMGFAPRVFEVASAKDWVQLVEAQPWWFPEGGDSFLGEWFAGHRVVEPDWARVARTHDAVHVTQLGYLDCAYAPIPCLGGGTTLAGWGPDVTIWLRDPRSGEPTEPAAGGESLPGVG